MLSVQFEFLANRPDAMPTIGRWYHQEWGLRLRGDTEQQCIEALGDYLNADKLPFILVAIENAEIVGAAQLKFREMEDIFPEKEHWLGGVYVTEKYRGQGIASGLVEAIASQAPAYGVETLYLQTEQLDGGLYRRLGWKPVQEVDNHGLRVVVMERRVGA